MNMKVLGAVAALGLLAGCVSNIEEVGKAKGTGSAFTQALTEEYKSFVAEEHDEYDWAAADYFARKGLTAAAGTAVPPEDPATYDLGDAAGEIAAARQRLITDLDNGGRDAKPAVAAKAQVKFDCWVHEQDEGWQKDEIAACKNDLMAALDELEKKEAAAAACDGAGQLHRLLRLRQVRDQRGGSAGHQPGVGRCQNASAVIGLGDRSYRHGRSG